MKKTYKHTQKTGRVRARDAAAVMSYCGWLKHAHCHGFFVKYVKPYVNFKKLKEAMKSGAILQTASSSRLLTSTRMLILPRVEYRTTAAWLFL